MSARGRLSELALVEGSVVIADLHLDVVSGESTAGFVAWIETLGARPALVVLGDLFDVWIGPAQAEMPEARLVLDALAGLTSRGTRVLVVPGNRDFLLDRSFAERTGAEVFPEGFVALLEGPDRSSRVLCIHGDTLCTRDTGYQRLRRVLRSRAVLALAPRVPRALGLAVARRLRRASVRAIAAKPSAEKAMQRDACLALAREHAADVVLCGHAHEFRDEVIEGGPRWIVLDAFGGRTDVVAVGPDGTVGTLSSAGIARR